MKLLVLVALVCLASVQGQLIDNLGNALNNVGNAVGSVGSAVGNVVGSAANAVGGFGIDAANSLNQVLSPGAGAFIPGSQTILGGAPFPLSGGSIPTLPFGGSFQLGAGSVPLGTGPFPFGAGSLPLGTGSLPLGTGSSPFGTGSFPLGTGSPALGGGALGGGALGGLPFVNQMGSTFGATGFNSPSLSGWQNIDSTGIDNSLTWNVPTNPFNSMQSFSSPGFQATSGSLFPTTNLLQQQQQSFGTASFPPTVNTGFYNSFQSPVSSYPMDFGTSFAGSFSAPSFSGQSFPGQSFSGQSFSGQSFPGQSFSGPFSGQSSFNPMQTTFGPQQIPGGFMSGFQELHSPVEIDATSFMHRMGAPFNSGQPIQPGSKVICARL